MTRLIDVDEMLKRLESWNTDDEMDKALYNFTLSRIIEQPPVDAVPVRHGKWVEDGRALVCSCCGKAYTLAKTNYCWRCGAKMEIDDDSD